MTLRISKLSKRYANNWVLRDVKFDVEPGRVLAILGAKSSGKTTLLRILGGLERPSPENSNIGLDRQAIEVFAGEGKGFDFRSFFRRALTQRNVAEEITAALKSGHKVIAFDDPLLSFELESRRLIIDHIRSIVREKQLSVIYATSDFQTAAMVAERIEVLADGSIQHAGTPEEIYFAPANIRVAKLTGRCNLIEARRLTSSKFEIPEFQTISGNHRLFAERADISKLGSINQNVCLAIRPEDISMSFGASFPEDNLLRATVTRTRFLGPTTLVVLDSNGLILEAAVIRLVGLDVGQECMVALPPDRLRILKD